MTEDSKIIDLFFARDEQAIAELAEKYGTVCHRVSENILKSELDAKECVNDAYLAAWNAIPPEKPNPLKTFILRIVRNISIAKYHANTAQKRNSYYDEALDELHECLAGSMTIEQELEAATLAKQFDIFLDGLGKESRLMFMCRYYCSESIEEIAAKFGTSKHNVSARLSRIREKLKKHLMKEGFEL